MAKKTAIKSVTLTPEEILLVLADASWLESKLAAREMKYLRSLNRFVYNGSRNESIRQVYTYPTNYLFQGVDDGRTGPLPSINIGRSMALTLQSKLIQTKGRVFFTAVNGLWDTIKTCRNAQVFFDAFVERDELNDKVKKSVLDALIFEAGYIWVDDETKSTIRIHPWQYFADQAEVTYGKLSRVMIVQDWHPVLPFKDRLPEDGKCATALENNPHITAKVIRYFDLERKVKSLFIAGEYIDSMELMSDRSPVVPIYYNDPVKGMYSNSIMDNSRQNQNLIDEILRRVRDAAILSPANTIFIPSTPGSNANDSVVKTLDALVGNVVKYDPTLGLPTVATPPPIDPAYVQLLEFIKGQSFDQEGISQLTAQSKVPEDVTSGVALDTLQDIQSTRFQTQVDNLIQFYKNIYTTMIAVFPEDDDILPPRLNRSNVKWSEIKRQRELYSLSSSLTSMLSKEPKIKMEQIEKLQAQKIINPNQAAQLMDIPDLESAYSVATASYDNCRKIIERAIDQQKFDFYNVVDLNMLLGEAVNTLLQLDSVDEDPRVLENLVTLINIVVGKQGEVRSVQAPIAAPPPSPPPVDVQDTAMNGAQVQAITEIVEKVSAGTVPPDSAMALISAAFPGVSKDLILQMMGLPPQGAVNPPVPNQAPPLPQPAMATPNPNIPTAPAVGEN